MNKWELVMIMNYEHLLKPINSISMNW